MRNLFLAISFSIVIFFASQPARAFEDLQLKQCITATKDNPVVEGQPETSIKGYCECALDLIVDQNKPFKQAVSKCAIQNFNG